MSPAPHPPTPIYSETSGPDPDRERLLRVWGFYVMLKSASCLATHGYLMAILQVKIKFRLKFLNLI